MGRLPNDNEVIALHISRRELSELIDHLRTAEELCASMRQQEQDFRMQRIRLEQLRKTSVPPPRVPRESTRFLSIEDLGELGAKKEPRGGSSK